MQDIQTHRYPKSAIHYCLPLELTFPPHTTICFLQVELEEQHICDCKSAEGDQLEVYALELQILFNPNESYDNGWQAAQERVCLTEFRLEKNA